MNNFKERTVTAVKDFQRHNGLKVTGVVNAETWDALFNDPDVRGVGDEPRAAAPLPYFFEVDVANQIVKVWKYSEETDKYTDLDQTFICTTGTKKNPSPIGTFTLNGRRARYCTFPTWGGNDARWWTQITPEIAFHSVIYVDAAKPETLVVSSLKNLGKRGSHGCIRLTLDDAKWVYDHAREGMKVWIHDDAAADPELKHFVQQRKERSELNLKTILSAYPAYDGTVAPSSAARALKKGDSGAEVKSLQQALIELGFLTGKADGKFGAGTEKAVIAFQEKNSYPATGIMDAMRSGLLYGNAAMIDGLIDRVEAETGTHIQVVATGGLAGTVIGACTHDITLVRTLVLDGLVEIYHKNTKSEADAKAAGALA